MENTETVPKKPGLFTRGRRRVGKMFTDSGRGLKKRKGYGIALVAGAAILGGAQNKRSIADAIGDHPPKVTGEIQGEPVQFNELVLHPDDRTELDYPAGYEATIRICTPIAKSRSETCREGTVFVTGADTEAGRAQRDGDKLTVEESMVGESRPHSFISKER